MLSSDDTMGYVSQNTSQAVQHAQLGAWDCNPFARPASHNHSIIAGSFSADKTWQHSVPLFQPLPELTFHLAFALGQVQLLDSQQPG